MPQFFWLFIAGALIGDRWGFWGVAAVVVIEAVGVYLSAFYSAWKADKAKNVKST